MNPGTYYGDYLVFGTDVYSSPDDVELDQTLLDNRRDEIFDAIDKYNQLVVAEDRRGDDGSYAIINMTLASLNVTFEPYTGDNIRKVSGKIYNCSYTTITLIVLRLQTRTRTQEPLHPHDPRARRRIPCQRVQRRSSGARIETIIEEKASCSGSSLPSKRCSSHSWTSKCCSRSGYR